MCRGLPVGSEEQANMDWSLLPCVFITVILGGLFRVV